MCKQALRGSLGIIHWGGRRKGIKGVPGATLGSGFWDDTRVGWKIVYRSEASVCMFACITFM